MNLNLVNEKGGHYAGNCRKTLVRYCIGDLERCELPIKNDNNFRYNIRKVNKILKFFWTVLKLS